MTAENQTPETTSPEMSSDAAAVAATYRLAMHRERHPGLKRAESTARLHLAAAIIAMDEAESQPGRHSLQEQAEVERAKDAYAQALADLLRGESGSCEGSL